MSEDVRIKINRLFRNGGETGELMNAIDWSKTSLGPVDEWPQNLKTCVSILLSSRQPMFVWWGEELINLYNDAYISIVGGKHPEALGMPANVVWREIWDQVGPRADMAMIHNKGTYDEALLLIMERNGYPEETYYTFSYSPIPGMDGTPEGIICANTDDTQRIIGERQLRTLKDLGKSLSDIKTDREVYENCIHVLRENPQDFPFACLYIIEQEANKAVRVNVEGNTIPDSVCPPVMPLDGNGHNKWPIGGVIETNRPLLIEALDNHFTELPYGAWNRPPDKALMLPVSYGGQNHPSAVLIIGLNPYRLLDDRYMSFFQLVTDQVATSISNVHAYEAERQRALALAEIDRSKTLFFSNVSHEFRTPLTLMLGPLEELLNKENISPAEERANLEATHRNAMRLLKLVNTLLDFSRMEAGRTQAHFQPVKICEFTADLASSFRSIMEKAGLDFSVECNGVSGQVYVDREMWEKIVLNLLSNAFKYTLKGGVKLLLEDQGQSAVLKVRDTGVGIPENELPRMFERFHRVTNTTGRTHEGTGIGLSLVNELVRLHGGNITVESKEGQGSTFTVTIPKGKMHLPAEQVSESSRDSAGNKLTDAFIKEAAAILQGNEETGGLTKEDISEGGDTPDAKYKNKHLLIVDDNADMRGYLTRLLSPYFQVETAANGRQALEKIQARKPDLVISDIMMPEMDGNELLQAIKGNPATEQLPVILLSARAGEEATIKGLESGADDYLVKPFSANELISRTKAQIKLSEARYNAYQQLYNLFEQAPIAIAIYRGPDFKIEMANETMLRYWGRNFEEVFNKSLFEALPEIKGQGFEELTAHVYHTGTRFISEETAIRLPQPGRENQIWYVKFVYEPLRDEQGHVTGIMALAVDITDIYKSKKASQESEALLRRMIDTIPGIVWLSDKAGNFTYLNKQWYDYTGQGADEALGQGCLTALHADDRSLVVERLLQANSSKQPFRIEFRLRKADYQHYWVLKSGAPRFDALGNFEGFIGTIMEIHERKLTEERLAETHQSLQLALDAGNLGYFELDMDTFRMTCTPKFKANFGRPSDSDFTYQELIESILPEDRDVMTKAFRTAVESGGVYSVEYRIRYPDGTIRWISASGRPAYDEETGNPLKMAGVTADITERKARALELEKRVNERTLALENSNEKLREQNEFIRTIIDASVDVIAVLDNETRFTAVNHKCEEMYGKTRDQLLGSTYVEVFPQAVGSKAHQDILDALNGQYVHNNVTYSAIINGYFENYFIPLRKDDGVTGVLIISHDITAIVEAAEQLRKANQELQKTNQDLEQFAYVASHDLKEPLRMISSYTQLLMKHSINSENADIREFSGFIIEGVDRMQALINDLLEYSRIGQIKAEPVIISCNQIVKNVLDALHLKIEETGTRVICQNLPDIIGIPSLLRQLFQNLIENAIKFRKKTESPVIQISAEKREGEWLFAVKDNGIGINPLYEKKIFIIFQRLHTRDAYPGTGIGLAISKRIVEYHGGQIWIESREGAGTTFFFTIKDSLPAHLSLQS